MAKKLSESLKESQLQEESRKELVASISHDLRTPLTAIKAYVEGLVDNVADTPEKKLRYLRVIKKKADELNNLIEQLFLFSKISPGEKAVPFERIYLKSVPEFFVAENFYVWQKSQADVELKIESNAQITGSFLLPERILSNVVSNSIKYRSEEKFLCKIILSVEKNFAVLSVVDNGIGVPEDLMTNANIVFSRETLYDRIWGMNSFGNTATVPVHINRLRDAVELDPAKPKHLITVWGVGYKFKP